MSFNLFRFATFFLASVVLASAATSDHAKAATADDFVHADDPHRELFSLEGGLTRRPLLMLYLRMDDVASIVTPTWVRDRHLGRFPSVRDYFTTRSGGGLVLDAASESEDVVDDGVVTLDFESFDALRNEGRPEGVRIPRWVARRALLAADEFVDFSAFDADADGILDNTELAVSVMRDSNPRFVDGDFVADEGGATRTPYDLSELDGITLDLAVSLSSTRTNLITLIHEMQHVVVGMFDFYGCGVGRLATSGPTIGYPETRLFDSSGYEKLHWGWIDPTVVAEDGWQQLEASSAGDRDVFVLHDPAHGADDYFVVENRQAAFPSYDQGISDSGLVIWRIDDPNPKPCDSSRRIELMRPDGSTPPGALSCDGGTCFYGGMDIDAWDPLDPDTEAFRTMARDWRDGTPSGVAVRGIGPSGPVVDAYFDLPGPGVMVDTYEANLEPPSIDAGAAGPVEIPVFNSDDAGTGPETFTVELDPPPGWSAGPGEISLAGQSDGVEEVNVGVAADAPAGDTPVPVTATSTSRSEISSGNDVVVRVNGVPRAPDDFESNDTAEDATEIALDLVDDIDPNVVEDFATVRSDSATWAGQVDGLNLGDIGDVDFFRLDVPDAGDPADGGHSELESIGDCAFLIRKGFAGDEDVAVTSALILEIDPLPRNAIQETLRTEGEAESTGTQFRRVVACPRSNDLEQVVASFGREPDGERVNFPTYGVRASYTLSVNRSVPDWVRDMAEGQGGTGSGLISALPCPSAGMFPNCSGDRLVENFELAHPLRVGADCAADGCPDHYLVDWQQTADFSLYFESDELGLTFELLDAEQNVVATAFPANQLPLNEPFGDPVQGQELETAETVQSSNHLHVPDLPEGVYVVRITGPAATYFAEFTTLDGDGDQVADRVDVCPLSDPGRAVDVDGCTGPQRVDSQCIRETFRNHGRYVSCVTHAARTAVGEGLLTRREASVLVREAARSNAEPPGRP